MRIFASTFDGYLQLTKPFAYLFNKFLHPEQEVTVLGYTKPTFNLPKNFNFISMAEKQESIYHWSNDLRKVFESIDDEYFIWTLNDLFLARPINFEIYNKLISFLVDEKVGRIALMSSVDVDCNGYNGGGTTIVEQCVDKNGNKYNVIEASQNSQYRITVAWSLWNREYLLKYLVDGYSPWEFEGKGGGLAKNDGYKILGTSKNYCIYQCMGLRKGNPNHIYSEQNEVFRIANTKTGLDPSIIEDMKKQELI